MVSAFSIPEEVRYTNGSGFSSKLSNQALDYLKVLYLPWFYDKTANSMIPDFDVKFGKHNSLTLKNITANLKGPEQTFIRNWKTSLLSNDTSLNVAHSGQEMTVDFDFYGKLKNDSQSPPVNGHLSAKVVNINFDFKTQFLTQDSQTFTGTGMDTELAPAVNIKVTQFGLANSKSEEHITGSIFDWQVKLLTNEF